MSADGSGGGEPDGAGGGDGPGRREVAYRVFAAEYDDATHSYSESDEERAPSYVVTPTGARANRLFVSGVLTAVEQAGESNVRARVVDPTGAFVVYAGQYEPEALATLRRLETPAFVAVTGKARTFETESGDRTFSTLRPEAITEVDAETRDRWVVRTARHTLARVATFADALDRPERGEDLRRALLAEGVDPGVAAGVPRAMTVYGTTPHYLAAVRELALDAARVVANERDAVRSLDLAPDDTRDEPVGPLAFDLESLGDDAAALAEADVDPAATDATVDETVADADASAADVDAGGPDATATDAAADEAVDAPGAGTDAGTEPAAEPGAAEAGNASLDPGAGDDSTTTGDDPGAGVDGQAADSGTDSTAEPAATPGPDSTVEASTEPDAAGGTADNGGAATVADDDSAAADRPPGADGDAAAARPADEGDGAAAGAADGVETDEMYEFDEEERESVREEFGVEFSTGEDIPEAGEADIETPDDVGEDAPVEETADAGPATDAGGAAGSPSADTLEDAVVDRMRELAEAGDGAASRADLVADVTAERDVDEDAVESAIQDALMSGRCFESGDGEFTPI
ncbi:MAG: RPA family protein [Halobacteriaceae archaeon]